MPDRKKDANERRRLEARIVELLAARGPMTTTEIVAHTWRYSRRMRADVLRRLTKKGAIRSQIAERPGMPGRKPAIYSLA